MQFTKLPILSLKELATNLSYISSEMNCDYFSTCLHTDSKAKLGISDFCV